MGMRSTIGWKQSGKFLDRNHVALNKQFREDGLACSGSIRFVAAFVVQYRAGNWVSARRLPEARAVAPPAIHQDERFYFFLIRWVIAT
jgi:hypothetical protein